MKALAISVACALLAAAPVSASVGNGGGDDDEPDRNRRPPAFSVSDGHDAASAAEAPVDGVVEGGVCAFLVTLKRGRVKESSVSWSTRDGTALAGSDYTEASGLVVLSRNDSQERVFVPTLSDADVEGPETFFVVLADEDKAKIGDRRGECVIHDSSSD